MPPTLNLKDPNNCRLCGHPGRVKDSRALAQWRRRRHHCTNPKCSHRWTSYQLMINPRRVMPVSQTRSADRPA